MSFRVSSLSSRWAHLVRAVPAIRTIRRRYRGTLITPPNTADARHIGVRAHLARRLQRSVHDRTFCQHQGQQAGDLVRLDVPVHFVGVVIELFHSLLSCLSYFINAAEASCRKVCCV
jgi:hypothetical protein